MPAVKTKNSCRESQGVSFIFAIRKSLFSAMHSEKCSHANAVIFKVRTGAEQQAFLHEHDTYSTK